MEIHKFPYNWKLAEANFTTRKEAFSERNGSHGN